MTQSGGRNAARYALGSTIVGVMAAATVVLTSVAPAASVAAEPAVAVVAPVAPAPLAAAAPVTARPAPTTEPTTRKRVSHDDDRPRTRSTRASASGCGQRAVDAGRFDASCDEYQGYLDPGTSAGRAPSSGETQTQWGCEQGYIPEDECG
ncbi:hypothetical protein EV188_102796 [Actinomycetospora succinea]|uniref:Uncharacterized protein n=1 Tax=Actinomycetospora succinea TaxID=663603 RepID=A0A4R6VMG6_9PSEU|nr:hypothetical protein [Actinomycetospora succinea]TDQ63139.1 hypothetical protein EV188_102796 [Actinomycetospora succinea]